MEESDFRRYLVDVDTSVAAQIETDVLVVGAGIAGLRAAIEAGENRRVIVVCKGKLADSNTWNAQGGIASVLSAEDNFESHIADTLATGAGLNDEQVVRLVVQQGPELIQELIRWGTPFDTSGSEIDIALEGGHSRPRVLHARGDSTGQAIIEMLIRRISEQKNIRVIEGFFTIDLITDEGGRCIGVIGARRGGEHRIIRAGCTILASGGAGQLYRETTNPAGATADGAAMAYRAGAVLRDMEFMQFHPTTLYVAGASRALITETLRGEGAVLVDARGRRFMPEYHPQAELAPRDVVSRAILSHMLKTGATHVYLDARKIGREHFEKRFPLISELCRSFDIRPERDLIPVRPSAHYMIGGVKTDASARTTLPGLFACGEAASTGLHGANRLGSNSLLEGLVFGRIAGQQAASDSAGGVEPVKLRYNVPYSNRSRLDVPDVTNSLRALMWRNVGIIRQKRGLAEATEIIRFWMRYVMDKVFESSAGWQCQNMLTAAALTADSALRRQESRGVHFRADFAAPDDERFCKHIECVRGT